MHCGIQPEVDLDALDYIEPMNYYKRDMPILKVHNPDKLGGFC